VGVLLVVVYWCVWFAFVLDMGVLSLLDAALFYVVPIGMIQAITNQQVGLKCVFLSFVFCRPLTMT
jgi:hypothetical protein